jgi:hypothetical protein
MEILYRIIGKVLQFAVSAQQVSFVSLRPVREPFDQADGAVLDANAGDVAGIDTAADIKVWLPAIGRKPGQVGVSRDDKLAFVSGPSYPLLGQFFLLIFIPLAQFLDKRAVRLRRRGRNSAGLKAKQLFQRCFVPPGDLGPWHLVGLPPRHHPLIDVMILQDQSA